MMKILMSLLALVLLASFTSAQNTTFFVKDLNTRVPIANATVTVYNVTSYLMAEYTTDAFGITTFNQTNGYAIVTKRQYYPLNQSVSMSDTIVFATMTPISTDGIVRFRITDLSMGDRNFCIFYKENMRLAGCYMHNDTATVIVNREYVIKPELTKEDAILGVRSMDKMMGFYIGTLFPLLILFFVGLIILTYTMRAIRKR